MMLSLSRSRGITFLWTDDGRRSLNESDTRAMPFSRTLWSSVCLVGLLWFVAGPWPRSWATASCWQRDTQILNDNRWEALESASQRSNPLSGPLLVGVGQVDLTARLDEFFGSLETKHLPLAGHGKRAFTRGNIGVVDPLFAKALFIDNGQRRLLILSVDLLLFNRRLAEGTLAELARRGISLRRDEILFGATHTTVLTLVTPIVGWKFRPSASIVPTFRASSSKHWLMRAKHPPRQANRPRSLSPPLISRRNILSSTESTRMPPPTICSTS